MLQQSTPARKRARDELELDEDNFYLDFPTSDKVSLRCHMQFAFIQINDGPRNLVYMAPIRSNRLRCHLHQLPIFLYDRQYLRSPSQTL